MTCRHLALVVLCLLSACSRSLDLPPPPGAGTLQGTIVFTEPGRSVVRPAAGATVELLNSSIATTVAPATGAFLLAPITQNTGEVRISFDADGDGTVDLQRLLRLEDVGAGFGRDVSIGQLTLGGNASVRGRVVLGDRPGAKSGLSGTTVFVPGGPYVGSTGDDGTFLLEQLPEGRLTLGFFRPGYGPASTELTLVASQLFTMSTTTLEPAPNVPSTSRVTGVVTLVGQDDSSGVTISVSGGSETATSNAAGQFEFPSLAGGLRSFGFVKPGFKSATQLNVLVQGASVELVPVSLAAGLSTTPDLDGGLAVPFDGGGEFPDAGNPDGGLGDPVAIVDGLPAYADGSGSGAFGPNGASSIGVRPLRYFWSVVNGPDAGITITPNDAFNAARPLVQMADPYVGPLRMSLVVEDARGLRSAPTPFTVIFAYGLPTASIGSLPSPVFAGQRLVIDGSSSQDHFLNNSGIDTYTWEVTPADAGIVATPLDGGAFLALDLPIGLQTGLAASVTLSVTNGLTLRSDPRREDFVITPVNGLSWTINPGQFQEIAGGSLATLSATATGPGAVVPLRWSWSVLTFDGGVPVGTLMNPNDPQATYLAPIISGPDQDISIGVTAVDLSGSLSPTMLTAQTRVTLYDERPAQLVATSVSSASTGSPFGAWLDFDEPLNAMQSSYVDEVAAFTTLSRYPPTVYGSRVRYVFDGFAPPGALMRIHASGTRDQSSRASNTSTLPPRDYTATWTWPAPATTATSSTDMHPAVVLVPQPGGEAAAHLLNRRDGAGVAHLLMPVTCDAGCAVTADPALLPSVAANSPRGGPRSVVANGVPVVALQTGDAQGDAGVFVRRVGASWQAMPATAGTLFTDRTDVFVARAGAGVVELLRFNAATNTWVTTTGGLAPQQVTADGTEFASPGTAQAWGWIIDSTRDVFVVMRNNSGDLTSSRYQPDAGSWDPYGFAITAGSNAILDFRMAGPSDPAIDGNVAAMTLRGDGALEIQPLTGLGFAPHTVNGVSAFDVATDETRVWFATIESGQLFLRTFKPSEFAAPELVPGPPRDAGVGVLNVDPTCMAESPSVARLGEFLVVAWQERCNAGPRVVHLRYVR